MSARTVTRVFAHDLSPRTATDRALSLGRDLIRLWVGSPVRAQQADLYGVSNYYNSEADIQGIGKEISCEDTSELQPHESRQI